jgi:hypothetical protein
MCALNAVVIVVNVISSLVTEISTGTHLMLRSGRASLVLERMQRRNAIMWDLDEGNHLACRCLS